MDDVAFSYNKVGSTDNKEVFIRRIENTRDGVAQAPNLSSLYNDATVSYYLGVSMPGFSQRKRRGELLPYTPFRQFVSQCTGSGMYNVKVTASGHTNTAVCVTPYATSPFHLITEDEVRSYWPTEDDLQYVQYAAAKLYSSSHDTLTFIAEILSVKKMFVSIVRNLHLLAIRMPEHMKGTAPSSSWLMWRYGIKPLIADLTDLSDAIANFSTKVERLKERCGVTSHTETVKVNGSWSDIYCNFGVTTTDYIDVGIRGSVIADIRHPSFQFNPFITAWEVIPYSFVIDWLLGVGRWIAAMSFLTLQYQHYAASGVSIKVTRVSQMRVSSWKTGASGVLTWDGAGQAEFVFRKPTAVPYLPQWKLRFDAFKLADVLSLLNQLRFK